MGLGKLGINGLLGIGILVSISSILVSIVSMINGTHKNEESGKTTNYKTTWRLINAILRVIAFLMIIALSVYINLIKKDSPLSKDFGWRKLIGTTILIYGIMAGFNILNLFAPWGEGAGVHIARIVIEAINICIGFIQFWSYSTKFIANMSEHSLDHVMVNNPLYQKVAEILNSGKVPQSKLSSMAQVTIDKTAAAVNEGKKEFGKRQRRRNPPKRRKKK
tara:strand:+ start:86 stop:745 length:660 start_codon:yes stop_codon:yes gene_type:complete